MYLKLKFTYILNCTTRCQFRIGFDQIASAKFQRSKTRTTAYADIHALQWNTGGGGCQNSNWLMASITYPSLLQVVTNSDSCIDNENARWEIGKWRHGSVSGQNVIDWTATLKNKVSNTIKGRSKGRSKTSVVFGGKCKRARWFCDILKLVLR